MFAAERRRPQDRPLVPSSTEAGVAPGTSALQGSLSTMRWPSALEPVLEEQSGLLTRRQAYEASVSRSQLRWALGRSCRIVLPGVISTFTGELDARQRLIASQLWAGPQAQLAGMTAVRWHAIGQR